MTRVCDTNIHPSKNSHKGIIYDDYDEEGVLQELLRLLQDDV